MHQPQPQICRRKDQFYSFEYEIKLKLNNFHSKKMSHFNCFFHCIRLVCLYWNSIVYHLYHLCLFIHLFLPLVLIPSHLIMCLSWHKCFNTPVSHDNSGLTGFDSSTWQLFVVFLFFISIDFILFWHISYTMAVNLFNANQLMINQYFMNALFVWMWVRHCFCGVCMDFIRDKTLHFMRNKSHILIHCTVANVFNEVFEFKIMVKKFDDQSGAHILSLKDSIH